MENSFIGASNDYFLLLLRDSDDNEIDQISTTQMNLYRCEILPSHFINSSKQLLYEKQCRVMKKTKTKCFM